MWTANIVEIMEGVVRCFGNLNSKAYKTCEEAWDACLNDFEDTKRKYNCENIRYLVNSKCRHIEFDNDDDDIHLVWEIQKMI